MSTTTIFLVFYTRPESEEELFLSAHATNASARLAAEKDARDQGHVRRRRKYVPGSGRIPKGWRWGLGPDGPKNPSICGDGKESVTILTDWTDMDDAGHYEIISTPLL